jgi:hypothetical protein
MDARRLPLIVVALLVAGCGGSKSTSGTTTSAAVTTSTSASASTSTSTSTSTAAPTTTTTVAKPVDLETFGPLGPHPALTITLPTLPPAEGSSDPLPSAGSAVRIEGGVLVAVTASPESSNSTSSTLTAIGFDGTKRWVQKIDSRLLGMWAAPNQSTALVALDNEGAFDYHLVSVADGQMSAPTDLAALKSFVPVAFSPSRLLLGRTPQTSSIPDALQLYDLATNKVDSIALPSKVLSGAQYVFFDFDDKGEPTVSPDYLRVAALYRNGSWVDDPSTINAAVPPSADFTSEDQTLIGHQATGSVIWPDPQFTSPGYENSPMVADGDISIVAVCTHTDNGSCTAIELDGIDTDTGDVVWTLPGFRMLGAVGDGYALVNDSPAADTDPNSTATLTPGWILIDTRTGKQVADDQHWGDSSFFVQGCCDDFSDWVQRFGGVVVAQNTNTLRVWLPREATPADEHKLSLP